MTTALTYAPEALYQLALDTILSGDCAKGETLARLLLGHVDFLAQGMFLIGLAKATIGNHRLAEAWFEQSCQVNPNQPDAWINLAVALEHQGFVIEAQYHRLRAASVFYERKELGRSLVVLQQLVESSPGFGPAYVNMAAVLENLQQPEQSIKCAQRFLKALVNEVPGLPDFIAQLPKAFCDENEIRLSFALDDPVRSSAQTLNNLGNAALQLSNRELAERAYRLSHELAPTIPLVAFNLSIAVLARGDFANGWPLYEQRWARPDWDFPDRAFSKPKWDGESLSGKTILVYCEQGFGDSIQFISLVPQLLKQGASVILEVQPELFELVRDSFEGSGFQVVPRIADPRKVYGDPAFDYHISVMSLPFLSRLELQDLPIARNYMKPNPEAVQRWSTLLPVGKAMKVGIVWAGNPNQANDGQRSIPFSALAPLWAVKNIDWHSLQVDSQRRTELNSAGLPKAVEWGQSLTNFSETAALIENLDLVITVCTSVAHLAGAMGKRTWVLLSNNACWRWLLARSDSPWYPTVQLFRQPQIGDWHSVIGAVVEALKDESSESPL